MTSWTLPRTALLLLASALAPALRAGEWDLGVAFMASREVQSKISTNGSYPALPTAIVVNSFTGPWLQGGLQVGYKFYQRGPWGVWAQGHYVQGLAHPSFFHSGQNLAVGTTETETFNGTASYSSTFAGLAVSRAFQVGELTFGAGVRTHDLSVEGRRQSGLNNVFTYDTYSTSHSDQDVYVHLSFTLQQEHEGFRSFQRFTVGTGIGSDVPAVHPGTSDWRMSSAYLARIRPNTGIGFTLGVRL